MRLNRDKYYSKKPMSVYDSFISKLFNKFVKNYSREEVASGFKIKGKSCLDIACGDGELLNNFLYKNYDLAEGVDISSNLISIAKSKKQDNCVFFVDDIDNFIEKAIKSGKKYDSIYLLAILEHIQWPAEFLNKVSRLLKKGGSIVIEVPNVAWLPHRLSLLFGNFPITAPTTGVIAGVYDEHIRFFTHKTISKIASEAGLKEIKFDCSGKFRSTKNIYPSLLSPDIVARYEK